MHQVDSVTQNGPKSRQSGPHAEGLGPGGKGHNCGVHSQDGRFPGQISGSRHDEMGLDRGRKCGEKIFLCDDGKHWGRDQQTRRLATACEAAAIDPPITFHASLQTYGSWLAVRGVALQVIADALGHRDSRLTEKHYAHLAPGHVANIVRANLPDLGLPEPDNVVEIDRAERG